jgi:hypothetical protein
MKTSTDSHLSGGGSLNVDQARSQFLTSSDFGKRVGGMVNL